MTALEHEEHDGLLGTRQTVRLTEAEAEELRGRITELVRDVTSRSRAHSPGDGSRPWMISTNMDPDLRGRTV